jgi:hypothetical protein
MKIRCRLVGASERAKGWRTVEYSPSPFALCSNPQTPNTSSSRVSSLRFVSAWFSTTHRRARSTDPPGPCAASTDDREIIGLVLGFPFSTGTLLTDALCWKAGASSRRESAGYKWLVVEDSMWPPWPATKGGRGSSARGLSSGCPILLFPAVPCCLKNAAKYGENCSGAAW